MVRPWQYAGTYYAHGSTASERAGEAKKLRSSGYEVKWIKHANNSPNTSAVVKGNAEYVLMKRKKQVKR